MCVCVSTKEPMSKKIHGSHESITVYTYHLNILDMYAYVRLCEYVCQCMFYIIYFNFILVGKFAVFCIIIYTESLETTQEYPIISKHENTEIHQN